MFQVRAMLKISLFYMEDEAQVTEVHRRLREEGFIPSMDRVVFAGEAWKVQLSAALSHSDVVLIFFSQNSVSGMDYFQPAFIGILQVARAPCGLRPRP